MNYYLVYDTSETQVHKQVHKHLECHMVSYCLIDGTSETRQEGKGEQTRR